MRLNNLKKPILISGIFAGSVLAALSFMLLGPSVPEQTRSKVMAGPEMVQVSAKPGHWLMTPGDGLYTPAPLEITKALDYRASADPGYLQLEEASAARNRQAETLNIMYIWTEEDRLKVISVTTLNKGTQQAAIVVVPLHTVNSSASLVYPGRPQMTVAQLYQAEGREGVKEFLEKKLDIKINSYIHVNQAALQKLSDIIGPLEINGGKVTMLQAFEETMAGLRSDDQDVVKAVGAQVLRPKILADVPSLISIFTRDIKTNLTMKEMMRIFNLSRGMKMGEMRKTALPGQDWQKGDVKYLFVSNQTWKNVVWDITQ